MPAAIAPGHVRLRLACAGICGTDLHYFRHYANAGMRLRRPLTLGHEASAWIEDANGTAFRPGELVALNPLMECGNCPSCAAGAGNLCSRKKFPGSATTVPHLDGFFQTAFDFPASNCRRAGQNADPRHISLTEPLACALHGAGIGNIAAGMRVLVCGCGPMGLLTICAAKARGAQVDAIDIAPQRVEKARGAGAGNACIAGSDGNPASNEYDVAFEASGSVPAFNRCLNAVRRQGRVVILSIVQPQPQNVDLHLVAVKEISVKGSILFRDEFDQALNLLLSGAIDAESVIGSAYPLAEIQEAMDAAAGGRTAGKTLLCPDPAV